MSRLKIFTRESLLRKATPVFLRKGYAGTSIQDIEQAVGIGKSSLYSEFESKEAIYLACMEHFLEYKSAKSTLLQEPLGWANIEAFLSYMSDHERKVENGCLLIYSMREHHSLSNMAKLQNEAYLEELRLLVVQNLSVEVTAAKAEAIANVVIRIFAGAAMFQNMRDLEVTARAKTVGVLMTMLRSM
jgi:AcrR family transcriptional regulator